MTLSTFTTTKFARGQLDKVKYSTPLSNTCGLSHAFNHSARMAFQRYCKPGIRRNRAFLGRMHPGDGLDLVSDGIGAELAELREPAADLKAAKDQAIEFACGAL